MRQGLLVPFAAALLLAACSPSPPSAEVAVTPPPAAEPAPVPVEPVPAPAAVGVRNDPARIHFAGYGSAKFGADAQAVRSAWGGPMIADAPDDSLACHYLVADPRPADGMGLGFMLADGILVRYDVDSADYAAPGDLAVGMTGADVKARFPGRVVEELHKYVQGGHNLVVSPEDGGESRLVFETDAADRIVRWRIGVPPAVELVEGCL